jgi:hypothetical protein
VPEREIVKWHGVRIYLDEAEQISDDFEFGGNVFLSSPNADGVRSRIDPDSVEAARVVYTASLDEMVNAKGTDG